MEALELGFPLWLRLSHFFNILFLTLLVRSGIEILGAHPMLYFNDDCTPGSEWMRFTRKRMPADELWTAEDEKQPYSSVVSLPGGDNLGLGRYWHFVAVIGWVVTGGLYVLVLLTSAQWQRLVPTSWEIFPQAYEALVTYLQFESPPPGDPYNAVQQLTYFAVVFVLAPVEIVTGIAMSPAVSARFPWFPRLFGGRQAARSIHFLGLVAFVAFTLHHVALVVASGFVEGMSRIVLGVTDPTAAEEAVALALTIIGLGAIVIVHVWATRASLRDPRAMQHRLQRLTDPVQDRMLQPLRSRDVRPRSSWTPAPRPNGRAPRDAEHVALAVDGFVGFRFRVDGLVEAPLELSLADLRGLPAREQTTQHVCIQGWSQVATWTGVPVTELLDRVRPLPEARYLLFRTFDDKWEHATGGIYGHETDHGYYYTTIDLELARDPQTILAYGMNDEPLPVAFGAPLRLRLENQLGYKMVKFVRSVELVADYRDIGYGQGGWRADVLNYSPTAPI